MTWWLICWMLHQDKGLSFLSDLEETQTCTVTPPLLQLVMISATITVQCNVVCFLDFTSLLEDFSPVQCLRFWPRNLETSKEAGALWRQCEGHKPRGWVTVNRYKELVFLLSTPYRDYSVAAVWLHYHLRDGALEDQTTLTQHLTQECVSVCVV